MFASREIVMNLGQGADCLKKKNILKGEGKRGCQTENTCIPLGILELGATLKCGSL